MAEPGLPVAPARGLQATAPMQFPAPGKNRLPPSRLYTFFARADADSCVDTAMIASMSHTGNLRRPRWAATLAALALACAAGKAAQVVTVPTAHLHHAEGTVAWSPLGDNEWHDVLPRKPLKRGDRLWTDRGSRAELQAGGHALRLDSQTQMILENVGDTATQLSVTQGSVVATVARLNPGDSFELGTPNLAFRARQPGDYRIDVDAKQGTTRIAVLAGNGVVFGERGEALELRTGQRATFRERSLAKVPQGAFAATDDFDRWAGARRRGEPTVSMPEVAAAAPAGALPAPSSNQKIITIPARNVLPLPPPPADRLPVYTAAPAPAPAQATPAALEGKPPAATTTALEERTPVPTPAALEAAVPKMQIKSPVAAAMRVTAPAGGAVVMPAAVQAPTQAQVQARANAQAEAKAKADAQVAAKKAADAEKKAAAEAVAKAKAEAAAQARAEAAAQRAEEERKAAVAAKAEQARRAAMAANKAEEQRRAAAARKVEQAKKAEEDRKLARRAEEQRRLQAKRAEEEKREAQARRAADEKRLAQARKEEEKRAAAQKAEAQKLAEARRKQLARLQEQAAREEKEAQARRDQARRADDERRAQNARREEFARREDQAQREEAARREAELRQRLLADQQRREQEKREQEVWLRQQQLNQPLRPAPMGVPVRRVS